MREIGVRVEPALIAGVLVAMGFMGILRAVFAAILATAVVAVLKLFGRSSAALRLRAYLQKHRMISLMAFIGVGALLGAMVWTILSFSQSADFPSAEVRTDRAYELQYLVVHNTGSSAEFQAQIEFDNPPFDDYRTVFPAYWEQGDGSKIKIAADLEGRIRIGMSSGLPGSDQHVSLYYSDPDSGVERSAEPFSPQNPRLEFRVRISSAPPMKDGPFVQRYQLTPAGGLEKMPTK